MGLLAYAGALAIAARRLPVSRQTLMAFTVADAIWVGGSAVVLVVEAFATLQFRAAGKIAGHSAQIA